MSYQQNSQPNSNQSAEKWYEIETKGLAYINDIKLNEPPEGKTWVPFYSVKIGALIGKKDNVGYEYYQLTVSSKHESTFERINKLNVALSEKQNDGSNNKILIEFVATNCKPKPFEYKSGRKKGELGVNQEGTLAYINRIIVNGVNCFTSVKPS